MMRPNSIVRMLAVALGFVALAGARQGSTSQPAGPRKPNIVLIVADDLGYADVGFQGCKDIPTPTIDALAQAGVRFTNAYASAPVCAPSRAGLLTGRYQQRMGFEFNPDGEDRAELRALNWPAATLPSQLGEAGYATALIGKWHLGPLPKAGPQKRGFDEFFGFFVKSRPSQPDESDKVWRDRKRVDEHDDITDALAREAVAFIERNKRGPFFLELAFNAPHAHVQPPQELIERFESIEDQRRRTYAAAVFAMDIAIGRVINKLQEEGFSDNTIIVFMSDNGGPTIHNSSINGSRNTPLRGSKEQLFEGGIRVPMVMVWPGHVSPGEVYSQPVIHLDLMPTILSAAGVEIDPLWLDGVNLLPFLAGSAELPPPHEQLCWRYDDAWAIRSGDWKLVMSDAEADAALYNLQHDISESTDVASANPEIVQRLEATWRAWNSELQPPAWPFKNDD